MQSASTDISPSNHAAGNAEICCNDYSIMNNNRDNLGTHRKNQKFLEENPLTPKLIICDNEQPNLSTHIEEQKNLKETSLKQKPVIFSNKDKNLELKNLKKKAFKKPPYYM